MSDFRESLRKAGLVTKARSHRVFVGLTEEVKRSVLDGSEITGAPGQPVDSGNLKGSWQEEFISREEWEIKTTGYAIDKQTGEKVEVGYAQHVEENLRGVTFRNGGPHSVKLTVAAMDRLLEVVIAREVADGGSDYSNGILGDVP